ncbi:MAG: biotin--[acetyl-CoA-carboxylase] ligase [Bacteroidota bacterium]
MLQLDTHIRTLETEYWSHLNTKVLGREVRFLATTDSTNTQAMQWAQDAGPEGALVYAEHQAAGRGRHGRHWATDPSTNLLFSLILRPDLPPASLGIINVAASIALADTINRYTAPISSEIKWPNDILVQGKKCCGMLLESAIPVQHKSGSLPVILGIGVNLNQAHFTPDIAEKASSLLLETGRHIPRMAFLAQFLNHFETSYFSLKPTGNEQILAAYSKRLAYLNEETVLRFIGREKEIRGILTGVSATGALQLQTADGLCEFHAGEVTSQPNAPRHAGEG